MTRPYLLPLMLAALVTGLNAVKPAVVDDSAYLLFARHLAHDPLHPYAGELFWYYQPQPTMDILLPPVLPYWVAAGIALFGDHLVLLKLWLFPFAWVLCVAVRSLMRRFAPAVEREGLIAFALSPAVLPLFSVMLDVPALALGAAAVALFVKGCDGGSIWRVLLAGVCSGLAMQTKYSMLTVPAVLVAYAFTRLGRPGSVRAMVYGGLAFALAFGLFAYWEWFLAQQHGKSHFLVHLKEQSGEEPLGERIGQKLNLIQPLLTQFGGLACGLAVAAGGVGLPRWVRIGAAAIVTAGFAAVCLLPDSAVNLGKGNTLPGLFFFLLGLAVVAAVLFAVGRTLVHELADADTLFLVGWLAVEVLGMVGMTPFPAARRVIGVCLAVAVLLFHLAGRLKGDGVKLPRWGVGFAVGVGLLVWGVDCWDALPEKVLAEQAAEVAKPAEGGTVWFVGHWGFQYHCDRAGMRHLVPWAGGTPMKEGDWLVVPVSPDDGGFYRPYPMATSRSEPLFPRVDMLLDEVAILGWEDVIRGQTIPNLYGGSVPIRGREHPRLRVVVYRVLRDWKP